LTFVAGMSSLHVAARQGSADLVEGLVQAGVGVDTVSSEGVTAPTLGWDGYSTCEHERSVEAAPHCASTGGSTTGYMRHPPLFFLVPLLRTDPGRGFMFSPDLTDHKTVLETFYRVSNRGSLFSTGSIQNPSPSPVQQSSLTHTNTLALSLSISLSFVGVSDII
jgi:hypothetical protein